MSKAMLIEHDTWLYSAMAPTGRLFGAGEPHPGEGWGDTPCAPLSGEAPSATITIEHSLAEQKATFDAAWLEIATENERLEAENADLKATIAKFDPDGDGKPGGSVAKATK